METRIAIPQGFEPPHPSAELHDKNGLEWWQWSDPVTGILQIEFTGKGVLDDMEVAELEGEFMERHHFELLVTFDCDVYKPRPDSALDLLMGGHEDDRSDRLLASFRKGVLDRAKCDEARIGLRGAATMSESRGAAAGIIDPNNLRVPPERIFDDGKKKKFWASVYNLDGTLSRIRVSNQVMTGAVGYLDWRPINPYCRETSYSADFPEKFAQAFPLIREVDAFFKKLIPKRWQAQDDFIRKHGLREKGWIVAETIFTTVTVNRNFRTGLHLDAGDLPEGFGNLTVLEGDDPYVGGFTVFPKYRCAVDIRTGDFAALDVHGEFHGNVGLEPADPARPNYERVTLVCYCREGMKECGSRSEEDAKRDSLKGRKRTPNVVEGAVLHMLEEESE